jgi:hypothetical protein
MKIKLVFILTAALFADGTAYGQEEIVDMLPRLETFSQSLSDNRNGSIHMHVVQEKDNDGKLKKLKKNFTILRTPSLVKELIQAFEQEKEQAQTIMETTRYGRTYKRYVFQSKDQGTTICMLDGTSDRMTFNYLYMVDLVIKDPE